MEGTTNLLDTLLTRLQGKESLEVEYKRGRGGLPADLWPTVSAFANTSGGWIVLGIREERDGHHLEGVPNPDRRLQEFYDLLRNRQKISAPVCGADDARVEEVAGVVLLVIRVPAASRKERPVYVGNNPYTGTYLRRNAGDYHCSKPEVDRMMREASDVTADSSVLEHFGLDDVDPRRWRTTGGATRRSTSPRPGTPTTTSPSSRRSTGTGRTARRASRGSPWPACSCSGVGRRSGSGGAGTSSTTGCSRRGVPPPTAGVTARLGMGTSSARSRRSIYPRLTEGLPVPFRLAGGARTGNTPAHIAMREALVNLLVHADYAETHASLIFRHSEGCRFQNPGGSRVSQADLLSGDRSDPRNPNLVTMFRLIGLADEAGTGIPKIFQAWRELGFQAPDLDVGTERYEFAIRLRYVHMLPEEDRVWLTLLGDTWTEPEQLALVYAKAHGSIDNSQLREMSGQHSADASKTLTSLRDRGSLRLCRTGRGAYYELSEHAVQAASDLLTQDVAPPAFDSVVLAGSASGAASPGNNRGSLDNNQGSLINRHGSPVSTEGDGGSVLPMPSGFAGDLPTWARLVDRAQPARGRRLDPEEADAVVGALAALAPLSVDELALLLKKSETAIRMVLRRLMGRGELQYLYPQSPSHPSQRYKTRQRDLFT